MARGRTARALNVYAQQRLMGKLTSRGSGHVEFRYDQEWLARRDAFPMSLSLPLTERPYREAVSIVLDNLLPDESSVRQTLAAHVGASGTDPFSLLWELGRDCVGALQFVPADEEPVWLPKPTGSLLTEERVEEMLRALSSDPLGVTRGAEFRISVAGAQEKTALLRANGRWLRPSGTTPSTHILKPPLGTRTGMDLGRSVENEYVCMLLVSELGLQTARVEMQRFGAIPALVVERFDRAHDGIELVRLPQEDVCQALGVPPFRKYEADGGPGMLDVLEFLLQSDEPEADRKQFIQACFVFWLLGATDGHAKNFSLAIGAQGSFRLAPLYDVLSLQPNVDIHQLNRREFRLAMAVGTNRHYRIDEIVSRHFVQTARRAGIDASLSRSWLVEVAQRVPAALHRVSEIVGSSVHDELIDSIAEGATKRAALVD